MLLNLNETVRPVKPHEPLFFLFPFFFFFPRQKNGGSQVSQCHYMFKAVFTQVTPVNKNRLLWACVTVAERHFYTRLCLIL